MNAALGTSWPSHQHPQQRGLTQSDSASKAALNTGTFWRICAVVFGPKVWSGQWFTTVLFQPRRSRASPKITRATGSGFQVPRGVGVHDMCCILSAHPNRSPGGAPPTHGKKRGEKAKKQKRGRPQPLSVEWILLLSDRGWSPPHCTGALAPECDLSTLITLISAHFSPIGGRAAPHHPIGNTMNSTNLAPLLAAMALATESRRGSSPSSAAVCAAETLVKCGANPQRSKTNNNKRGTRVGWGGVEWEQLGGALGGSRVDGLFVHPASPIAWSCSHRPFFGVA